jgi:sugar phosphate isomerase/epimerase
VRLSVGAFYNPHLGRELADATSIDHLAMADPPRADDPWWPIIRRRYTLLLHDYLGQLSEPLDERAIERARSLAALYDTPWVAEHFQCLHTEDGRFNINYVFPPLYTEEFLERFVRNATALKSRLDQPLVMENIPGFFDVKASQMPEPVWLRRFFEATETGFLLDLPHVWLEAHYRGVDPLTWLAQFPLDYVTEVHVAGVEADEDLGGPWIAPAEPSDAMLGFAAQAVDRCPMVRAVTFDAFSPSLTADALLRSVERIRAAL